MIEINQHSLYQEDKSHANDDNWKAFCMWTITNSRKDRYISPDLCLKSVDMFNMVIKL